MKDAAAAMYRLGAAKATDSITNPPG